MVQGKWSERTALVILGAAGIVLGWLNFVLVRQQEFIGVLLVLVMLALIVLAARARMGMWTPLLVGVAAIGVLVEGAWLATDAYPLWVTGFVSALVAGFLSIAAAWSAGRRERAGQKVHAPKRRFRILGVAVTAVAAVLSAAMVTLSFTPFPLAAALQSAGGTPNSFDPDAQTESKVVGGALLTNDIRYGDEFPNSYLDVYIADHDPSVKRPTYLIVHGGGFIAGSKSSGDPNADSSYFALGAGPMLDAGYNLVSIGYGLAPQIPYPTPVKQLGQAIDFLQEHGSEYGIDMDEVVLSGGSAGGHIAAQYANIQTNPAYAEQMAIKPTLERGAMKALVLDSAALDPFRGNQTQSPQASKDWLFGFSSRAYFGTSPDKLAEASIIGHATADFPPTFVSDGNTGTFPDQAADLAGKLNELGVENALNLYPSREAVLGHGFMAAASPYTDDYNRQKLEFLTKILP